MTKYKHLFFDLDNTIIDFRANAIEAFGEVFSVLNLESPLFDPVTFVNVFEKYNDIYWSEYRKGRIKKEELKLGRFVKTFAEIGIDDTDLAMKAGNLYLELSPQKTNVFSNVHETLQYLKGKYNLYLLTNGFTDLQIKKLKACNLESYFRKTFIAELIGYQKPDRRIFDHAVRSVNAHKIECLMIGDDTEADMEGAAGAGIDQVFFNPFGRKLPFTPTYEIKEFGELRNIL